MSTPRPAILVAIVTAPKAPAPAMIRDSSVCLRAFNTWCGMPLSKSADRRAQSFSSNFSRASRSALLLSSARSSVVIPFWVASRRNSGMRSLSRGSLSAFSSGWSTKSASLRPLDLNHAWRISFTCSKRRTISEFKRSESLSEFSTEVVPTNCGRPITWQRMISNTIARTFPSVVR